MMMMMMMMMMILDDDDSDALAEIGWTFGCSGWMKPACFGQTKLQLIPSLVWSGTLEQQIIVLNESSSWQRWQCPSIG